MKIQNCRICNASLNREYVFREMMFGFRDKFAYAGCSNCGAVQILEVPADINKYYPSHYLAFTQDVPPIKRLSVFKRLINVFRIERKYRRFDNHIIEYLKPVKLKPSAKILDIGCGKGALICSLYNLGFEHVSGTDKFIPEEIDHGNGIKVYKKELSVLNANAYDLLIMWHVLEHVDDQVKQLKDCYRLLKHGGILMVSIPVLGEAWEIYRENWVQLDAPRHYVLHTLQSMAVLADKTGFVLGEIVFDSTAFQFWGSELYKMDIPLTQAVTHEWYPPENVFTAEQMRDFENRAKALNAAHKGDSARFYLYKQ